MKLPGINYQWQADKLATRDIYAPQKVANAQASAAGAWAGASRAEAGAAGAEANASRAMGRVYEQVGGYVTKAMMDIQEESFAAEAQNAYTQSISQLNELENKLYTSKALSMDDPLMEGINYDDAYEVVDGDEIKTLNSGFAPTHEVGQKVWNTKASAIVNNFNATMSKGAQKKFNAKIQDQVMSKTQNMGRHVLKMNVANKQTKIKSSIDESNRVGDTGGAIRIAEEAHKRGIIDEEQMNSYVMGAMQQGDLLRFNQQLSTTTDEKDLATLSSTALFTDNYMTTAQKVQSSNAALSKIRMQNQEARQQMADWRDQNTMDAIIQHYKGELSVADLNSNPEKYGRSNFVPLFDRMTKPTPQISDQVALRNYGEEIINAPFGAGDPEEMYRDLRYDMSQSVKRGDMTPDDFVKMTNLMDNQAKAPFNRQPYQEAKKAVFVDILGNLDAASMEEINNMGVNVSSLVLKKMGQSANVSKLAMRAFEDLNAYVRRNGGSADPIAWWKENKSSYQTNEDTIAYEFGNAYPNEAITLQNGKVDVKASQDNITRAYRNGEYGVVGSNKAMMEYSRRAAVLKGVDPRDIMQ